METSPKFRNCSLHGEKFGQCHVKTLKLKSVQIRNITDEESILLSLRTGMRNTELNEICLYHEEMLLKKYTAHSKKCSNPFGLHQNVRAKSLKVISTSMYEIWKDSGITLIPGAKLCPQCYLKSSKVTVPSKISVLAKAATDSNQTSGSDYDVPGPSDNKGKGKDVATLEVNEVLKTLDETPLKLSKLNLKEYLEYKEAITSSLVLVTKLSLNFFCNGMNVHN